ncbi:hypothetical protein BGZ60DRAFT_525827 [Tricladium varicosporioides]|nr:hypothetical protein BGZ60DRAFT_525827 [Hymenoscyphus varicosporioides]
MPGTILLDASLNQANAIQSQDPLRAQLKVKTVEPIRLPNVSECSVHLELLEAIITLKCQVESWGKSLSMDGSEAWDIFVKLAADRFVHWIKTSDQLDPPLDVLMVWHAFMLSPRSYFQFEKTVLKNRKLGKGIDWATLNQSLSQATLVTTSLLISLQADIKSKEALTLKVHAHAALPSFDLVAAVHRQIKFSETMCTYNWLNSPFVQDTLERSIGRYEKFFALIAANPSTMFAPTIDIDLAWHTHQLSPALYRAYSVKTTGGRFINHDDTLSQDILVPSFDSAQDLFTMQFKDEYIICLCWHCEAERSNKVNGSVERTLLRQQVIKAFEDERVRRQGLMLHPMMEWSCGNHGHHHAGNYKRPDTPPRGGGNGLDVVRQTVARAVAEVVEGEAITYQGTLNVQIRRLGEVEVDVRHVVHQTVDLAVAEVVEGEETMTLSAAEFQIYILRAK